MPPSVRSGHALGFAVTTVGYLAVTTGESLLAPVVPVVRQELGLDLGTAGLGSGTFFASGLHAAGVLGGTRRRGLAIGLFGVAFSGGLAAAGLLAALADARGWRLSYLVVAGLAAVVGLASALAGLPDAPAGGGLQGLRGALRRLLRPPLLVAAVSAFSQYGTVAFLPTFAVLLSGLSPASAALALTAARLLSVPAKLVSGNAADQAGAFRIARRFGVVLGALGLWWTVAPGPGLALWAAVVFATLVSGLGPVVNVLAFDSFGDDGMLLGAFRSVQIGLGAAIGGASSLVGLRPTLLIAALAPLVLLPSASTSPPGRGRWRPAPDRFRRPRPPRPREARSSSRRSPTSAHFGRSPQRWPR